MWRQQGEGGREGRGRFACFLKFSYAVTEGARQAAACNSFDFERAAGGAGFSAPGAGPIDEVASSDAFQAPGGWRRRHLPRRRCEPPPALQPLLGPQAQRWRWSKVSILCATTSILSFCAAVVVHVCRRMSGRPAAPPPSAPAPLLPAALQRHSRLGRRLCTLCWTCRKEWSCCQSREHDCSWRCGAAAAAAAAGRGHAWHTHAIAWSGSALLAQRQLLP